MVVVKDAIRGRMLAPASRTPPIGPSATITLVELPVLPVRQDPELRVLRLLPIRALPERELVERELVERERVERERVERERVERERVERERVELGQVEQGRVEQGRVELVPAERELAVLEPVEQEEAEPVLGPANNWRRLTPI
jgi:hypothetical protein